MSHDVDPFAQYLNDIEPALSHERLARYRPPGVSARDAVVHYLWNIALSEALYPSLHVLEVSLRNAIHGAATDKYGTAFWFDLPGVLKKKQPDAVAGAREVLAKNGKQATSGRIVAELSFGFWTTLLSGSYEVHFWRPAKYAIFKAAFPYLPMRGLPFSDRRAAVHQRYNAIRLLRNRVFHFEPIWDYADLEKRYEQILEAVGWINPRLRDTLIQHDRFPEVLQRGEQGVGDRLASWVAAASNDH